MSKPPKKVFTKCNLIRTDDDEQVLLDIAPTMKNITYKGEKYFKMDGVMRPLEDSTWARCYLWDGWWRWTLAKKNAAAEEGP